MRLVVTPLKTKSPLDQHAHSASSPSVSTSSGLAEMPVRVPTAWSSICFKKRTFKVLAPTPLNVYHSESRHLRSLAGPSCPLFFAPQRHIKTRSSSMVRWQTFFKLDLQTTKDATRFPLPHLTFAVPLWSRSKSYSSLRHHVDPLITFSSDPPTTLFHTFMFDPSGKEVIGLSCIKVGIGQGGTMAMLGTLAFCPVIRCLC